MKPGLADRQRLNQRLRAAFLAGAEEDSRKRLGRGLTTRRAGGCAAAVSGRRTVDILIRNTAQAFESSAFAMHAERLAEVTLDRVGLDLEIPDFDQGVHVVLAPVLVQEVAGNALLPGEA